jgi:hypothetical protein
VRKVFISYAREDRVPVDKLFQNLGVLGCEPWFDTSLHGGQEWWEEILRRIADCDAFIAVVSKQALDSVACGREFDWAQALGKPVVPVAVEPPPPVLPGRLSTLQIVDYSKPGHEAALALAGSLATLRPASPLPEPLPVPPEPPLSYLTGLTDLVAAPNPIDHQQQREIIRQVEAALRSADRHERSGGVEILEKFSRRDDLYADVDRTVKELTKQYGRPQQSVHGVSQLAIWSLAASTLGLFSCGFTSVPGIILGVLALNKVKKTGQAGRSQALAGIAVGTVTLILGIVLFVWLDKQPR